MISHRIPIQDIIHEGAKLRTRLLKRQKWLVIGEKVASPTFFDVLLQTVGKDAHLLKEGDLNLHDKMNYGAVERLCRPNLRLLLADKVPGK